MVYVIGVEELVTDGQGGAGRLYVLGVPIAALALLGARAGLLMSVLGIPTPAVFAFLADWGLHMPEMDGVELAGAIRRLAGTATAQRRDERRRTTADIQGRILVVDDSVVNRMQLKRGLEQQGHTVALAENGRQALDMLDAGDFDLVLLDILMPEMDGFEVLARLKNDPAHRDLPVIVISALDDMESVVRCISMGAEDFLPKPFNQLLLRARLGACLEKKRLRDQEVEYLQQVAYVTAAAAAVEAGQFTLDSLDSVAARPDALGQLGRVFQRMAREVYAREQSLKQQVQELRIRIQIDEAKKAREVAEITETDYFRQLRSDVGSLRKILDTK